jgi:transposase
MGGFTGRLWSKIRYIVKTSSGRSRYNVLGALDFVTQKVETITNDAYISADQVILLIDKLLENYKHSVITLVMDNARYQHCKSVTGYAESHGVRIVFLSTYSPNLNLIERLWKFEKSEVLNAAYYGTFDDFKKSIDSCVSQTNTTHLQRINSLVSENVQQFSGALLLAA